jgi:hypothetical protein
MLGDLQSACHILQHMVAITAQNYDSLRLSSKRIYQSSRLDLPVPALCELEDLKKTLNKTREYSVDVQPELSQEETRTLENVHVEAYVFSAGLFCYFCVAFSYAIHNINILLATWCIKLILFQFFPRPQSCG